MTWLKLVEGYMPMQMISELAGSILIFALVNYTLKKIWDGLTEVLGWHRSLDLYPMLFKVSNLSSNSF